MAQPGSERRESPRVLVELRVEFRHLGRPNETYADIIRNLSQGGVFLDTSVGLPVNTELELEVSPGPGARPVRLAAQVVRVEEEPVGTGSRVTTRTRGMALRFVNADPSEVSRLMGLARHLSAEGGHGRDTSKPGQRA
jgi:uncharacterized protein (TIGR02266 family)